ncbi:MAG: UDP-N-acetylmuramoyl-L-alanine--D-glutamate ligase, partial [Chitinophagaceae bacterium]|nr:UDP-N-acetylmuramoyl-L-alanine--D-glutamate ligase [Chitinophagaceae bacterium]
MAMKLVIIGGGESGVGAAILATQMGYSVFLSDGSSLKEKYRSELIEKGIAFEEGQHDMDKILAADQIVKSPGIPENTAIMKAVRAKGIPVISEVELAYRFKGDSRIVAITGSNGKTTTTSLVYQLCKS